MPSRTIAVLGLARHLSWPWAVPSRARPARPGPAPNQVRTELFATLDGRPVTDLASGDVQLLEDGVPQTIDRFDLVQPRVGEDRLSVVVFVDTLALVHRGVAARCAPRSLGRSKRGCRRATAWR